MNVSDLNGFRELILALYKELDSEIARISPICELSGRCCRFKDYDHTLFLSAPEAQLLVADAPSPVRFLDQGETCPWQDEWGHCQARDARPLGCRIYFCDPSYQEMMPLLSETYIARLKGLVDSLDLPWNYAPLHVHLRQLLPSAQDGHFTGEG